MVLTVEVGKDPQPTGQHPKLGVGTRRQEQWWLRLVPQPLQGPKAGWCFLSLEPVQSWRAGFLRELQKLGPWGTRETQTFNFSEPNFLNKGWCRHPNGRFGGGFPGGQEQSGS